ncbi:MAG: glycosyltransferase [Dysgonomonas sp.]
MTEQFLAYFRFNIIEISGLSLLFLLFIIQLVYYFKYYRKPYIYAKKTVADEGLYFKPKVSIVIVSENEVVSLRDNLPAILEQDYPEYEVIVVNNGSTDESDELLRSLELKYPNLYHTYLPYSNDRKMDRRKLALTLGVKAANNDILVFTEPYCKPVSNKWLKTLLKELTPDKDIVLGYSFFTKAPVFFNRMARFDNLLFSMQSFSMAIMQKPYVGNYRNLVFRRQLFFDNKGFASLLHIENGEGLFISQILTSSNTSVSLSQDSFIETNLEDFSLWRQIKRSYFTIRPYLKSTAPTIFKIETYSRCFFYLLLIASIVYSIVFQQWALLGFSALLFLIRLTVQLVTLNKISQYFYSGKFRFSLLVLDIIQPLYNLKFKSWLKRH